MAGLPGFFDFNDRLKRLSDLGDQLDAFGKAVYFEMFRDLSAALDFSNGSQGGRPPFDPVMMFKVIVIQTANNLSDERAEFLINDRLSFMRFLGLTLSDRVPDAGRPDDLADQGEADASRGQAAVRLLRRGASRLWLHRLSGQIDNATLVWAPEQRMTDEERKTVKDGRIPEDWKQRPAKLRHKDRDARWTVKFKKAKERADGTKPPVDIAIPTYGHQNHVSIDAGYGFIRKWQATDAASYGGAMLRKDLLDKTDTSRKVWADTAYRSKANEKFMEDNASSAASIARSPRASR